MKELGDKYKRFDIRGSEGGGRRMCKGEQDEFIRLVGACGEVLTVLEDEPFGRRLGTVGGEKKLKSALTGMKQVVQDLAHSAPYEQMLHLGAQLDHISTMTYIGKVSPMDKYRDQGRWMSFEDLNRVMIACKACCSNCIVDDVTAQRKCPVNKLLDVMPVDKPETGGCGWMEVLV